MKIRNGGVRIVVDLVWKGVKKVWCIKKGICVEIIE
jgi:hypothetical protein